MKGGNMPTQLSRRTIVTMLGGTVVGQTSAWGHDLRPGDPSYRFQEYEAIVNRSAQVKQVYQWPNIANAIVFPNIRNGLNGFQFSYDIPPDEIQVVVQAYSSANAATYDDFIWEKYRWGEALAVRDPQQTSQPRALYGPVHRSHIPPLLRGGNRRNGITRSLMTQALKACSAVGCCSSLDTRQPTASPVRRARAVGTPTKKALKK
jgi:hypothetical protein